MEETTAQERRFAAIAAAAAQALRSAEYRKIRTQDVAAMVRLGGAADRRSSEGARSAVWLYNEVRSRRVLVAFGARDAWDAYLARLPERETLTDVASMTDALDTVTFALEHIVRFHRAERFLLTQVLAGIGDIATSEKAGRRREEPAQWPDSSWGRLARAAFDGRCAVYADFLAPVLLGAARSVAPLGAEAAAAQAAALSDLVFRGLSGTPDGPTERVAAGFAAYWFERELVAAAGLWIRELSAAERAVRSAGRRGGRDAHAVPTARGELIRVLLAADTLHARAIGEGAMRVAELQGMLEPSMAEPEQSAVRLDLSDAASRYGLALLRYGEARKARSAFELSHSVSALIALADAEAGASLQARAEHNLAEAAMENGDRTGAVAFCEQAFAFRCARWEAAQSAQGDARERAAVWRRYLLTAELGAKLAAWSGRPVDAVVRVQALLRECEDERDDAAAVRLGSILGEALIEAGHPLEARHRLEAVLSTHNEDTHRVSINLHGLLDRLRLARAVLAVGDHEAAVALIPDDEMLAWCADRVAFGAAARARGLLASAHSLAGRHGKAVEVLAAARQELDQRSNGEPPGTIVTELEQTRGVVLLRSGDPASAHAVFAALLAAGAQLPGPPRAAARMWQARAIDALGESSRASSLYADLAKEADGALEPTHPLLLEAGLDQAERLLRDGDFTAATRHVAAVLDERVLDHGWPAVERGHPLRARARRIADALGLRSAPDEIDWDED